MKTPDENKRGLEWEEVDKALQKVHFDDVGVDTSRPKTPAEIKQGMKCCMGDICAFHCDEYPYADCDADVDDGCDDNGRRLLDDAMAYIRQLEAERDAAVSELIGTCQVCRWEETEKCASCHFNADAWNVHESNWEWRGLPEPPKEE